MSRTYRRKNVNLPPSIVNDNVWIKEIGISVFLSENRYRSYNDIHSDKLKPNAPKYFRKMLEKMKRAKRKREINKINSSGDYETYSFDPIRNDANYDWW